MCMWMENIEMRCKKKSPRVAGFFCGVVDVVDGVFWFIMAKMAGMKFLEFWNLIETGRALSLRVGVVYCINILLSMTRSLQV